MERTSWFKKKELPNGNFRLPAHQGPLAGSNLLEKKEEVEAKIANTAETRESKTKARCEAYEKWRAGCACDGDVCAAAAKKSQRDDPGDGPSAELSEDISYDELGDESGHDDHECEDPYKIDRRRSASQVLIGFIPNYR